MMSLWDALRMNMMISYQELVRTFLKEQSVEMAHNGAGGRDTTRTSR
ncbi:IS1-like element transposase [Escherichia coli]